MNFRGSGRIRVFRNGRYVLVSRKKAEEITMLAEEAFVATSHPLKDMGFFCLSVPDDDDPFVSITGGNVRLTQVPVGTADLDSRELPDSFEQNGRMLDMFYHGFTPDTEGFLVFQYTHGTADAANTAIHDIDVDFGAVEHYDVGITPGLIYTDEAGNTVEVIDPEGGEPELLRFAVVFVTDIPLPSPDFFFCPLCKVSVNSQGFPHVDQVHIGDIHVPKGFQADITDISVNEND
jgi:hypothetical protein